MDKIFIFLQYILPQHLFSRCTGWLAGLRHPLWLKNWFIHIFVRHFKVDMGEALNPDPTSYASFNAFFTRPLREAARSLAEADIVCPADGAVSQIGDIQGGRIFQAKGQSFSTWELLGGDAERAAVEMRDHVALMGERFTTLIASLEASKANHADIASESSTAQTTPTLRATSTR